jgi:type IV pilus assembly protein PilE
MPASTKPSIRKSKGFTLIELMIVVAIIGILASISMHVFGSMRERGYVASMKNDAAQIRTAQESYFTENSTYTVNLANLTSYGFNQLSTTNAASVQAVTNLSSDYKVTVSSSSTSKTVVYDSTVGTIVVN